MGKGCKIKVRDDEMSRVIEMAWEDRTPFEAINKAFSLSERDIILLMRSELKQGAFRLWRKRVSGRKTKHLMLRPASVLRGHCPTQYKVRSKTKH
ncbi:MAG: TIGR03643 family protein [Cellvibrionales bacterium TMED49]|nr:TIGR03643 family protein [Porticoccaceae bacterium]OUU38547.1 MAG: TIGR03643 family protein [Cellvibrionales bacterium TMED49]